MTDEFIRPSGEYNIAGHWMERMEQQQDEQTKLIRAVRDEQIHKRNEAVAVNIRIDGAMKRIESIEQVHQRVGWGIMAAVGTVLISSVVALWTWLFK